MAICNTVLVSKNCRCKKSTEENDSLIPDIVRRVLSRQGPLIPKLRFFETPSTDNGGGGGEGVDGEECDACEGCEGVRYEAESPDDLALVEVGTHTHARTHMHARTHTHTRMHTHTHTHTHTVPFLSGCQGIRLHPGVS